MAKVKKARPCDGTTRNYGCTWTKLRKLVLKRDAAYHGGVCTCEYCGAREGMEGVEIQVDHIFPWILGGGEFDMDNLLTVCWTCNRAYGGGRKPEAVERLSLQLARERNRA